MADIKTADRTEKEMRLTRHAGPLSGRMKAVLLHTGKSVESGRERAEEMLRQDRTEEDSPDSYAVDRTGAAGWELGQQLSGEFNRQMQRSFRQGRAENLAVKKLENVRISETTRKTPDPAASSVFPDRKQGFSPSARTEYCSADFRPGSTAPKAELQEAGRISYTERPAAASGPSAWYPYRAGESYPSGRAYHRSRADSTGSMRQSGEPLSGKRLLNHRPFSGTERIRSSERLRIRTPGISVREKESARAAREMKRRARASARTALRTRELSRRAAKGAVVGIKKAGKAAVTAARAILAGTRKLIAALMAGGWTAVVVIIILCLAALVASTAFGIFLSGEETGSRTGPGMQEIIREIDDEYDQKLEEVKREHPHDRVEFSGSRAVWKEVLAVYAVKVSTDPENPQEVATMNPARRNLLSDIFREMNQISCHTGTEGDPEDSRDPEGSQAPEGPGENEAPPEEKPRRVLYITINGRTADEMAEQYGFNREQKAILAELLREENDPLWTAVLYGIRKGDGDIVSAALSQVGNVGGEPYWSWYGFPSRVEWCACFVSWCADQCGYIEAGLIPKYSWCVSGVQWFRERGQWMDGSAEPLPGMIIFFDWDLPNGFTGPQDGKPDHTGIVVSVENGRVYTVEGNSGDSCRKKSYPLGYYEILGYGTPDYTGTESRLQTE